MDSAEDFDIVEREMKDTIKKDQIEFDEVCRDMYVPEDFQRIGGNKTNYVGMQTSTSKKNIVFVTNDKTQLDTMLHFGNKTCNEPELIGNHSNDYKSKGNNDKTEDTKENNIHFIEKYKAMENTKESRTRNEAVDWENLNSFISRKFNVNEDMACYEDKTEFRDDRHKIDFTLPSVRYLNPVEKLAAMKERDMLKKSTRDKNEHYFHDNLQNQMESQYFAEQHVSNHKNSIHTGGLSSWNAEGFPSNQTYNAERRPSENKRMSRVTIDNEKHADRIKEKKSEPQEMQLCAYTSSISYPINAEHSMNSKSKETFDYNHGLPFKHEIPAVSEGIRNSTVSDRNDVFGTSRNHLYARNCSTDLEKEFPPSDEIDRSIYIEKIPNREGDFVLSKHSVTEPRTYTSRHSDISTDKIQRENRPFPIGIDNRFEQIESEHLPNVEPNLINTNTSQFDFKPRIGDYSTSKINSNYKHFGGRNDFVLNPDLGRITRKPQFLEEQAVHNTEYSAPSLADDLRETTRKLLANSQQFSRYNINICVLIKLIKFITVLSLFSSNLYMDSKYTCLLNFILYKKW